MVSPKKKEAVAKYCDFVENIEEPENPFKEVYAGMVLGRSDFIKGILARLEDSLLEKNEFDILKQLPVNYKVTDANANEKSVFRDFLSADKLYVADAGYSEYKLLQEIINAKSSNFFKFF